MSKQRKKLLLEKDQKLLFRCPTCGGTGLVIRRVKESAPAGKLRVEARVLCGNTGCTDRSLVLILSQEKDWSVSISLLPFAGEVIGITAPKPEDKDGR